MAERVGGMSDHLEFALFGPPAAPVISNNKHLSDTDANQLHSALSLDPLVAEYVLASRADNTRRAYDVDLRHFQKWGGHLSARMTDAADVRSGTVATCPTIGATPRFGATSIP